MIGRTLTSCLSCLLLLLLGYSLVGADDTPATPDDKKLLEASVGNLKQLILAVHNYHDTYGSIPPQALLIPEGKPQLSWRVSLLPFLGEDAKKLHAEFKLNEAWDSPHNIKLLAKIPKVYAPMAKAPKEPGRTYYQVCTGPGTPFPEVKIQGPRFASFKDGLSNTLLILEAGEAVPWTKPEDVKIDPKKPLPKFGGMFKDVFHVGMLDGVARRFRRDYEEATMRLVINPADGTPIDISKVEAKR